MSTGLAPHFFKEVIERLSAAGCIVAVYLYLFNAFHVVGLVDLKDTADNLLGQRLMPPMHAIFGDENRGNELQLLRHLFWKGNRGVGHRHAIGHDHIEVTAIDFPDVVLLKECF